MSDAKKPAAKSKPGKPAMGGREEPADWPGATEDPDNPGNPGVGVGDHVFFHVDGKGPHAGEVLSHGVHGCTVKADKDVHKVRWGRYLGLKKKAVVPAKVVDRGVEGSIIEHEDGRRVYVAGELPFPDEPARLGDLASMEDKLRAGSPAKLADHEGRARGEDLAKAMHQCSEGPALCALCREREESVAADDLAKSIDTGCADILGRVTRLRARPTDLLKSLSGEDRRVPVLFTKPS